MIIHKSIRKAGKRFYLCNQATSVTKGKYTSDWNQVTCKNCLRGLSPKRKVISLDKRMCLEIGPKGFTLWRVDLPARRWLLDASCILDDNRVRVALDEAYSFKLQKVLGFKDTIALDLVKP